MSLLTPDIPLGVGVGRRPVVLILLCLGVISGAVYLFNFKLPSFLPLLSKANGIQIYLVLVLILSILYLGAVLLVLKNLSKVGNSRILFVIILFFASFFRICLMPTTPTVLSQDIYRYVWDGRVQQNGINPYLYQPAAPELKSLQDDKIFPHINRKQYPTIYPAAAQIFFRIFYALAGDSVTGYKGFMVFFDILTLLTLTALLRAYGFEKARLIIYAWNPLVIFEISYSGHLEGLMVFFLVMAFYLQAINSNKTGIMLLAVASALKLYPALLLAAFLNRGRRIQGILVFVATLVLLYLPYVGAGPKIIGFLPTYLNNPYESFNLGLKNFILFLIPGLDYALLSHLFIYILLIAALLIFIWEKQEIDALRAAYWLTGLLLICMPASLHPWYVILITPFLILFPSPAWLIFTSTVSLSYLKYVAPGEIMPSWVLLAEYPPLFILLAVAALSPCKDVGTCIPALCYDRRMKKMTEVKK